MKFIRQIIVLTILVMFVYVLIWWTFYGENATIIVQGDIPDSITGVYFDRSTCTETFCEIETRIGSYDLIFEKQDKYPITQYLKIPFFSTAVVTLKFEDKPYLRKVGESRHVDIPLSKIGISFQENQKDIQLVSQVDFPKKEIQDINLDNIRQIVYSQTGSGAMIKTDDNVYYYDAIENISKKTVVPSDFRDSVFDQQFFWFLQSPRLNDYVLWRYDILSDEKKKFFTLYNTVKPRFFLAGTNVLLNDRNTNLLLNVDNGEKFELPFFEFSALKWSPDASRFIFQDQENELFLFDVLRHAIQSLPIEPLIDFHHIDFLNNNQLVWIQQNTKNAKQLEIWSYDVETKKKDVLAKHTLSDISSKIFLQTRSGEIYIRIGNSIFRLITPFGKI